MTYEVHLDWETASEAKLGKSRQNCGAWKYSEHPSTHILSLAWGYGPDKPHLWLPCWPFPKAIRQAVEDGATFVAHGAQFERAIWWNVLHRHDVRVPFPLSWRCTLAQCAYRSLPHGLGDAGDVTEIPIRKDKRGDYLISRLSKRHKPSKKWPTGWVRSEQTPDKKAKREADRLFRELYRYNLVDVETEHLLDVTVGKLPEREQMLWELNQVINERGVQVDLDALDAAMHIRELVSDELTVELRDITNGQVASHNCIAEMGNWLHNQGVNIPDLTADEIKMWLGRSDLPEQGRRVLEIRQALAKSSLAKLDKIKLWVMEDGRIRGMSQYHGAATGRDAGRGPQLHNMPRPVNEDIDMDDLIALIKGGEPDTLADQYGGSAMQALADAVRGMFVSAPGHDLQVGDYGAIEARITAWIAGEEWKLKLFEDGGDPYCAFASTAVGREVLPKKDPNATAQDKKDRQIIGKPGELAFGYQGGVGAWRKFDSSDNFTDAEVNEFKKTWRKQHPGIVGLWYGLERAAGKAVYTGKPQRYANVWFVPVEDRAGWWLSIVLPNGKQLWYYKPQVELEDTPWGVRYKVTYQGRDNKRGGKWGTIHPYGGFWTENVVQATARELLGDAMFRVEFAHYPIILTVYDEIVSEPAETHGSNEHFAELMGVVPQWAPGLPLAVDPGRHKRYRK